MIDPEQARKILRIYRGAKVVRGGWRDFKKTKSMLEDHRSQSDFLMDAEELVSRVREKRVRPEDVRDGARAVVNSVPKIYRFAARHISKNREKKDA